MSDENNALLLKLLCVVEKGERGYKRAQNDDATTRKPRRLNATKDAWVDAEERKRERERSSKCSFIICTGVNSGV